MIAIDGLDKFFERIDERKKIKQEMEFWELLKKVDEVCIKRRNTINNSDKRRYLTIEIEYRGKALQCYKENSKEGIFGDINFRDIVIRILSEDKKKAEAELDWLKANFT